MEDEPETRIALRMPSSLHETIAKIAKAERRSVNGQIVYLLERAIKSNGAEPDQPSR